MTQYYVTKSGSDTNDGTASDAAHAWLTLAKAYASVAAGDTINVGDGTYAEAADSLPNGSAGAGYTILKAINDGGVILTGGLSWGTTSAYRQVEGLRFHDTEEKSITGDHHRIFRTEFKGGPASGNTVSVVIGTSDATPGATNVLLEDCWVHGYGGRYKVLVYNSENVVCRRVVFRHDGRDQILDENPMSGMTQYDSENVIFQNCIGLDHISGSTTNTYVAAYYIVNNGTTATANNNKHCHGCINIDPDRVGYLTGCEGQTTPTNVSFIDCVGIDGTWGVSQLKGNTVIYRRLTLIDGTQSGFGIFGGSSDIDDCVIADFTNDAFNAGSGTNCAGSGNGSNTGLTVVSTVYTNGLEYPVRIESGSTLASGGTFGQRGANIVKRIGTSGTLYGETGYNDVTSDDLWPFPNEARILKEMCTDVSVTRGLGSDTSLTNYIMNQFGNGNPYAAGSGGGSIALFFA